MQIELNPQDPDCSCEQCTCDQSSFGEKRECDCMKCDCEQCHIEKPINLDDESPDEFLSVTP